MKKDNRKKERKSGDRIFLYPLCRKIYRFGLKHGITDFPAGSREFERLYVNEDAEEAKEREACKTISYMLITAAAVIAIAAVLAAGRQMSIQDGKLHRMSAGGGSTEYDLTVDTADSGPEEIKINVSEQKYTGKALDAYLDEACTLLEELVLAGNPDAEHVSERLDFIDGIEGTAIEVSWPDIDETYFYPSGAIVGEAVTEPVIVYLSARLEYYDEVRIYSFPVRLVPKDDSEASLMNSISEELAREDIRSAGTEWFNLPAAVEGVSLDWSEKERREYMWILPVGFFAVCAIIPAVRSEIGSRQKKREEEMLRDYPDIISKFVLLVTAGMTCRAAWAKICRDYTEGGGRKRYAYEEMLRSERELRFGTGEAKVYEDFGKRCGVAPYRRFGILLANNLKRGSRDLTGLLEQEAFDAIADRSGEVKKNAQEAGTRLLLPMFGMLCLVFAIILVPAFSAFGA